MLALFIGLTDLARATQADDTIITITGQTAGATPFLSQISLMASDTSVLKSIQFVIAPKAGALAPPLSATYGRDYLVERGYLLEDAGEIFLPVYGLYAGVTNTVTLTYRFLDGSFKQDSTAVPGAAFDDQGCGYNNPSVLAARTAGTQISYGYIFIRSGCGDFSPVIIDTDGALRWVSPVATDNALTASSTFFNNAVYRTDGTQLLRVDLDGTVTVLGDYASLGVLNFSHNIDPGKSGLILEFDTATYYESEYMEVDLSGAVQRVWSMGDIISDVMIAGGDDPTGFVQQRTQDDIHDWFHTNAAVYDRANDSIIFSSRENFVIALDYATNAVRWILGDQTKKWYLYPSLAEFALTLAPDSLPPIGQHSISLGFDQQLLLFDNGLNSLIQDPHGILRNYASPRRYQLNLLTAPGSATEVWNYERDQSIYSPFCGSVYEDAPYNYLVDYAFIGGPGAPSNTAQLLGLNQAGELAFNYEYPTVGCDTAYNSLPLHLETTKFPVVGPQALNISARAMIAGGDNVLIAGFIVSGDEDKTIVLRALGPSLSTAGVSDALPDPIITLFDASGAMIATNDDWESDARANEIASAGLAPASNLESATVQTLTPGAYTAVVRGKADAGGIGLVDAYDLSPDTTSRLANISARGLVGTGDNVLISGFIVGDVGSATVIVRALGPSLSAVTPQALADPVLTVYDSNGAIIAGNDNWQDNIDAAEVAGNNLGPSDSVEAAVVLRPPAGAYSAIVTGAAGGTGVALVEVYDLD